MDLSIILIFAEVEYTESEYLKIKNVNPKGKTQQAKPWPKY